MVSHKLLSPLLDTRCFEILIYWKIKVLCTKLIVISVYISSLLKIVIDVTVLIFINLLN